MFNKMFSCALRCAAAIAITSSDVALADTTGVASFDAGTTAARLAAQAELCNKMDRKLKIERRSCKSDVRRQVAQLTRDQVLAVALFVERHEQFGDTYVDIDFASPDSVEIIGFVFGTSSSDNLFAQDSIVASVNGHKYPE